MNVASTRFGTVDVPPESLLTFPSGLLGFPEWTSYVILDHDTDAPFKWLHCTEEASLAFVVIDPALFNQNFQVTISPEAQPTAPASTTTASQGGRQRNSLQGPPIQVRWRPPHTAG